MDGGRRDWCWAVRRLYCCGWEKVAQAVAVDHALLRCFVSYGRRGVGGEVAAGL
jgi:hypothetical protein